MVSSLWFQQVRTVTSVFCRNNAQHLWKTITSVSTQGRAKGRHKGRQRPFNLNAAQRFGEGQIRLSLPGFHSRVTAGQTQAKLLPRDEDHEKKLLAKKEEASLIAKARKKVRRESVPPLLRGYSGTRIEGRKLGPPPPVEDQTFEGFETVCVKIKRREIMTGNMGGVAKYSATVVVGNGDGLAGFSVAEGGNARQALNTAIQQASKRLSYIHRLEGRTIFHDFYAEKNRSRIFARRAEPGHGLHCHRCLKTVCELVGIKDIYCKVEGTTKKYASLVEAMFTALRNQETFQQIAEKKQLHVVEFSNTNNYLPRIVASPLHNELKKTDELDPLESLDLDDVMGAGRTPWYKGEEKPFYANLASYKKKLFLEHRYRNHINVQHQLMKDGYVNRWTRTERNNWSKNEHEKVISGEKPLPKGIGLCEVRKNDIV